MGLLENAIRYLGSERILHHKMSCVGPEHKKHAKPTNFYALVHKDSLFDAIQEIESENVTTAPNPRQVHDIKAEKENVSG